jgi:acyl-CoA thioesterase-1
VLAFGNSITFGTGANPGEDYPSHLAASSGWQVHNAGVPGDTAAAARDRIDELARHTSGLVIVEIGGNDFLRRRPEAAVKEDLRAIIAAIRQSGAQVVLVAVPKALAARRGSGRLPDAKSMPSSPSEEKLPLVPGFSPHPLRPAAESRCHPPQRRRLP